MIKTGGCPLSLPHFYTHTHTHATFSHKKKAILLFLTMWMDPEGIMVRDRLRETKTV